MKSAEFQRRIGKSSKPIIVDLWAPWCRPCQTMAPAFEEASKKYQDRVDILKINADESTEVLKMLGVMGIPTVIGFADGKEIVRRTGMQSANMLEVLFEAAINRQKPVVMPIAPVDRIVRLIVGLAIVAVGWFSFHSYLLIAIGAIVLFTAFYDRCPIYRAVAAKVKSLFHRSKEQKPLA